MIIRYNQPKLLYRLFHTFFGSYTFEIQSARPEYTLNILKESGAYFYDVKPVKNGNIVLKASVLSAKNIAMLLSEQGAFEITERTGLPFIVSRYNKRYGLLVGIPICFVLIFLSSLFVWDVRIESSGVDDKSVLEALKDVGLDMGTYMPNFNVRDAENKFLIDNTEYSNIAMNIQGTVVFIEIEKADPPPDIVDVTGIYDVTAKLDGTIISVEALDGTPAVSAGDAVKKGDVLISGTMEGRYGEKRGVHARGKVMAEVNHNFRIKVPVYEYVRVYTGKSVSKTTVELLNFSVDLFKSTQSPYEFTEIVEETKKAELWGIKFPLNIQTSCYTEYTIEKMTISQERAMEKAKEAFSLWKQRTAENGILTETSNAVWNADKTEYILTASITIAEDIGEETVMPFIMPPKITDINK